MTTDPLSFRPSNPPPTMRDLNSPASAISPDIGFATFCRSFSCIDDPVERLISSYHDMQKDMMWAVIASVKATMEYLKSERMKMRANS